MVFFIAFIKCYYTHLNIYLLYYHYYLLIKNIYLF